MNNWQVGDKVRVKRASAACKGWRLHICYCKKFVGEIGEVSQAFPDGLTVVRFDDDLARRFNAD